MAPKPNVLTIFCGSEHTASAQLQCFADDNNQLSISIDNDSSDPGINGGYISLDKYTAIKLSKELRRQIAIINEKEVQNG